MEHGAAFLTSGEQICRASSFPPAEGPTWQLLAHGFGGYSRAPRGGPERCSASGARARKDSGLSRAMERGKRRRCPAAGSCAPRGFPPPAHESRSPSPEEGASPQHRARSPRSIPCRGTRSPRSIPCRGTRSSRETLVPLPATSFTFHFGEGEDRAVAGAERGHPGRMLLHGEPVAGGSSPPPRAYILAPPEPSSAALPASAPGPPPSAAAPGGGGWGSPARPLPLGAAANPTSPARPPPPAPRAPGAAPRVGAGEAPGRRGQRR